MEQERATYYVLCFIDPSDQPGEWDYGVIDHAHIVMCASIDQHSLYFLDILYTYSLELVTSHITNSKL